MTCIGFNACELCVCVFWYSSLYYLDPTTQTDGQIPYLHKDGLREFFSVDYLDSHLLAGDTVDSQLHQPCQRKQAIRFGWGR